MRFLCRPRWPLQAARVHGRRLLSRASTPSVTAVEKIIIDGIKATGPISFATYMQMCLSHPTAGYYMNPKNPIFGSTGDFVTSPEITSLFGELLGVWLMSQWFSGPKLPIRVVELGPGRGTLMHDLIRVIAKFGNGRLKSVHLVETSSMLRELQEAKLMPDAQKYGCTLSWHDSVDEIAASAEEYTMVVAHEFFDALPFHTIERTEQGWHEILIALAEDQSSAEDLPPSTKAALPYPRLRYVMSPQPSMASNLLGLSSPRFKDVPVGSRLEVSPVAFKTMHAIGELIRGPPRHNPDAHSLGCGLIVDYGANRAFDQSFRAFKKHQIVDIFHTPGECDLTTNVDFAYLREAVGDLVPTYGPITQAAFLRGMQLPLRVEGAAEKSADGGAAVRAAAERLVDPRGMGEEYKVLAIGGHVEKAAGLAGPLPFVEERPPLNLEE